MSKNTASTDQGVAKKVTARSRTTRERSQADQLRASIIDHLRLTLAHDPSSATKRDWWIAISHAVRDHLLDDFIETMEVHNASDARRVYYLSLEYLMGRLLNNNIHNSGLEKTVVEALDGLPINFDEILEEEPDMGLGNGGLGRLAACFLDSLATLDLPSVGYGIRYEFGLFQQQFIDGHQIEHPDNWRRYGNPWEIIRPEYTQEVRIYGRVENRIDENGDFAPKWVDSRKLLGVPFDLPIAGYGTRTVNFLRLWESRASEDFDFQVFNEGGYVEAVREKAISETISKVLYPNDATESGKELRLVQQYFFVSCSLQDILRRFFKKKRKWTDFPKKVAIQLNDTHPAVAVPELMRILLDDHGLSWKKAWDLTRRTFSYTNHTLLPEALEKWSVPLFEKVLPRHLQIIYEINRRFLEEEVEKKWPGNDQMKADLSLIEEGRPKMIRMAYLSVVASHAVNGVAALHTRLLKQNLLARFDDLYPGKIRNKTNGITPRRWLLASNPGLTRLIMETIGDGWQKDLGKLRKLETKAKNKSFQKRFMEVKRNNKTALREEIRQLTGVEVDPEALFDVQIKRLHEYKRQHLNLLHILTLYHRLLHDPELEIVPRVFVFAAKAAPGYELAKNIIRAINKVGEKINGDDRIRGLLKVVFLPNYSVSLAEKIIPAADLSEQISTAGKEASGTGNMKLALNGALTIGTLDGANVEILDEVGSEHIHIFGLKVEEITALRENGYDPVSIYLENTELKHVLDWLSSDAFTPGEQGAFQPLVESLLGRGDPYFVLADYAAYIEAQEKVETHFRDKTRWAESAILNTARVGKFSSDRTIGEYAEDIWDLKPLPIPIGKEEKD